MKKNRSNSPVVTANSAEANADLRTPLTHTVAEVAYGNINNERMIAIMNNVQEIAAQYGTEIERKSGSIRGIQGASYEVKIGEVTIAIKRTADQNDKTLSDLSISFKSPDNDQAIKQAQALAQETTAKIKVSMLHITEKFQKATVDIQEAQFAKAVNRVGTAVNAKNRSLKLDELSVAVKIITASDHYKDCEKQQILNDLQSIDPLLVPKQKNMPKYEHTDNEMKAFEAVGKLEKLLARAKATKNIPVVSGIVRSQINNHLDKMNSPSIKEGLQQLGQLKVERTEKASPSRGK